MHRMFSICFAITLMMIYLLPFHLEQAEGLQDTDGVDLLEDSVRWDTANNAELDRTGGFLNMTVTVDNNNNNETNYNRIFTTTNLTGFQPSPMLNLTYSTNSTQGDPKFIFEVRGYDTLSNQSTGMYWQRALPNYLGSIDLGNTLGDFSTRSYEMPFIASDSSSNHEIIFYIITNEPTNASMVISNATISKTQQGNKNVYNQTSSLGNQTSQQYADQMGNFDVDALLEFSNKAVIALNSENDASVARNLEDLQTSILNATGIQAIKIPADAVNSN